MAELVLIEQGEGGNLEDGVPLRSQELSADEQKALSGYQFLTAKARAYFAERWRIRIDLHRTGRD